MVVEEICLWTFLGCLNTYIRSRSTLNGNCPTESIGRARISRKCRHAITVGMSSLLSSSGEVSKGVERKGKSYGGCKRCK